MTKHKKGEIFAVIWQDFVPLWLPYPDKQTAIREAKAMVDKMNSAGHGAMAKTVRAVYLPPDSDKLSFLK